TNPVKKAKDLRLDDGCGHMLDFSVRAFEGIYRQNGMPGEQGQYKTNFQFFTLGPRGKPKIKAGSKRWH
ncbi:MAG TPA: hypothetical protein VK818_04150, partial [Methylomirabilota bacterium]|nr:hypothetical protein [Methylomirabilota bacterium]